LKFTIDDPVEVPGPVRDYYTKTSDGKFTLDVDGHPDAAKLSEFRDKNVELLKERDALKAKFDGIDAEADRRKLTELEKTTLEQAKLLTDTQLEVISERAARANAQDKANRG